MCILWLLFREKITETVWFRVTIVFMFDPLSFFLVYDVRNESEINCADDHKKHTMDIPYEWELQTTANCDCATFTAYPSEMRRRAYIVALTDKYDRNKRQHQYVTSRGSRMLTSTGTEQRVTVNSCHSIRFISSFGNKSKKVFYF